MPELRSLAIGCLVCFSVSAWPQGFPAKPIRIVAPEVSGGSDLLARSIASGLSDNLGKTVVVDNRGFNAGEIVARAQPDGYTLLLYGSPLWLAGFLRHQVPFDPVRDFAPITVAATTPNVLVVHPSLRVTSVTELIVAARAAPGQLNYSSGSSGSTQHLAAELFNVMAGTRIVRVPFRGSGPALNSLMAGEVQMMFPSAGSAAPHLKSGRLRALAVTSAQPSALVPGLSTLSASGLPGYESTSPFGIFAPAGTAPALIARLNAEIVRVLASPVIRERMFNLGVEPVGSPPAVLAATVKTEMAKWGKLITDLGIRE
jgi:tripartite-type tricarboxylate transporter receptor subunit TctC